MGFFKCSQLVILFLCVFVISLEASGTKYGVAFRSLMDENGYKGGATGVLVGNRLAYVEGYGTTLTDHKLEATTTLPASGISKILTALTVLKLIQEGKVYPSAKVFGADGLLSHLVDKKVVTDKRIFDITVDDLLRHSGGWDADISQMADPVFNEFLVDGNQHIVNISKQLKIKKALSQEDIIQFMLTQNLDFTPGTKSTVSNVGYLILGRVIEQVANETYAVAVKEDVLVNCGMWHTRIGPHQTEGDLPFKSRKPREINAHLRERHQVIGEYYAYIQPHLVDSSLGWFTNAYDVMRLAQCLDGTADYMLLNATTIDLMLQKPRHARDVKSWFGAGFMVHENGAVWVSDETHAPDVVFLHKNLRRFHPKREYTGDENEPVAWTLLFEGKPSIDAPLKQLSRVMIESETHWPTINSFVDDLYDRLLSMGSSTKVIKMKIEEHRANQYLIALKRVEFNVVWVNAYTYDDGTYITVIAEQDPKASHECVALAGLPLKKLVERKLELQEEGYNITFIQNYKSFSHRDKFVFIGVFHKGAFRNDSHILYGIQHFDRPYKTLLSLYEEKGFKPLVQSVEYNRDDALLTFILEADSGNTKDQKEIYSSEMDLTESRLERAVHKYAKQQSRLVYLDASNHRGRPKFSALFKKSRKTKWQFSLGQTQDQILDTVTAKQKEGYLPSVIVGYSTTKKSEGPKFAIYLEKPTDSKRFL